MHCPIGVKVAQIQTGGYTCIRVCQLGSIVGLPLSLRNMKKILGGDKIGSTRITMGGVKRMGVYRLMVPTSHSPVLAGVGMRIMFRKSGVIRNIIPSTLCFVNDIMCHLLSRYNQNAKKSEVGKVVQKLEINP